MAVNAKWPHEVSVYKPVGYYAATTGLATTPDWSEVASDVRCLIVQDAPRGEAVERGPLGAASQRMATVMLESADLLTEGLRAGWLLRDGAGVTWYIYDAPEHYSHPQSDSILLSVQQMMITPTWGP